MPPGSAPAIPLTLFREGFTDPPEMDTAVSRALLQRVADGEAGECLRLHRPRPILAFGPRDRLENGYAEAVEAAGSRGFAPVQRLAGGRAAVFHEGTIAFSWCVPDPRPREGIRARFETVAEIMAAAFRGLGVDARIGEVPGEYCPGEHSVNARGAVKVMGVGQRVIDGAAHVGGVIVVEGADRIRDVLVPVNAALGLPFEPATVGSLADEAPGTAWEAVAAAVVARFSAAGHEVAEGRIPAATLALARSLVPRFGAGV